MLAGSPAGSAEGLRCSTLQRFLCTATQQAPGTQEVSTHTQQKTHSREQSQRNNTTTHSSSTAAQQSSSERRASAATSPADRRGFEFQRRRRGAGEATTAEEHSVSFLKQFVLLCIVQHGEEHGVVEGAKRALARLRLRMKWREYEWRCIVDCDCRSLLAL